MGGVHDVDLRKTLAGSLDDIPCLVKGDWLLAVEQFGDFERVQRGHQLFRDLFLFANISCLSTRRLSTAELLRLEFFQQCVRRCHL